MVPLHDSNPPFLISEYKQLLACNLPTEQKRMHHFKVQQWPNRETSDCYQTTQVVAVSKVYLLQYTAQMLIIFSVNEKGSFDSSWLHQFHTTFYIIEQFHYQRFFSIKQADSSMLMIQTRCRKVKVSQAAIIMLIIFHCAHCHHGSV